MGEDGLDPEGTRFGVTEKGTPDFDTLNCSCGSVQEVSFTKRVRVRSVSPSSGSLRATGFDSEEDTLGSWT